MKFTKLDNKVLKEWNNFCFGYNLVRKLRGSKPIPHDMSFRTTSRGVELFYKGETLPSIDMSWDYFDEKVKQSAYFLTDAGNPIFQWVKL